MVIAETRQLYLPCKLIWENFYHKSLFACYPSSPEGFED